MNDDGAATDRPDVTGEPQGVSGRRSARGAAGDSHAEQVLSQALRLMAGGGAAAPGGPSGSLSAEPRRRITTGQLLLLAAIVGLLLGICAGFLSLVL